CWPHPLSSVAFLHWRRFHGPRPGGGAMNLPRSSLVPCVRALLSFLFLAPITPTLANSLPFFWREVGPPTRSDHAGVYDPVGDRLVIFGGTEGATPPGHVSMLQLIA